ncbi:YdcF family protein [Nocardia sp. X0981]
MLDSFAGPAHHRSTRSRSRTARATLTTLLSVTVCAGYFAGTAESAPPAAPLQPAVLIDVLDSPLVRVHGPETAIVILGYGLLPDGSMRPELTDRLRAGYVQALLAPQSPVIVTGGNPRNGRTEAAAMSDWLLRHGLPAQRVHQEATAGNTVENAERSAALIHSLGARDAVVVTSENHIARATRIFLAAGVPVTATLAPCQVPAFATSFAP